MSKFTKESSVAILSNSVKMANSKGVFSLPEAAVIKKAVDYFNKDVKEKSKFNKDDSSENTELVAVNLLIQGVQKAQLHVNNPYSLDDAAILVETFEFLQKEYGSAVAPTATPEKKDSKKSAKSLLEKKAEKESEDEEEDDEDDIRPIKVSTKGKERA
jgi:cytochrome c biogenesis protein ResB